MMGDANQQKKRMRIALVGVRPADQITLKGYFRVLLRLDADLEWVSATESSINLFVINDEFKQASSVVKLLSSNSGVPVLYIDRVEDGDGGLNGNLLTLPLKQVHELNDWLQANVGVSDATSAFPGSRREESVPVATPAPSLAPVSNEKTESLMPGFTDFVELIKIVHAKKSSSYEIVDGDNVVAVIDTGRQLVWTSGASKINQNWRLRIYTGANKDPKLSQDAVQWLWSLVWQNPETLTALIDDHKKYQLRFWVKPNPSDRRDLLQIMTALEKTSLSLAEVASRSGVSIVVAKKALAAFLVAGVLDNHSYQNLTVPTTRVSTPVQVPEPPPAPKPRVEAADTAKEEEKMGFLSRLRRKLGL